MTIFEREFKGKTVFVTGNTGFMGMWLSLWLTLLGATVIGYSLDLSARNQVVKSLIKENKLVQIFGDVNDLKLLTSCISEHRPDYVFHLAAQPLVRTSYELPHLTIQTNVMGTVNVLESIRKYSSEVTCVVVTSDKCYDNKETIYAYKETDPMGGYDPYSASKGATELVTASYRNSFFTSDKNSLTSVSTIRAGNIIGGGDWAPHRIVPDCMCALYENKTIVVRNPNSVRPWQYVLEPISGLLLLAQKMRHDPKQFSNSWNFGPESTQLITVQDLVKLIISDWGKGDWVYVSDPITHPHEAQYLMLNSNKSKTYLEWSPVYSINESVHETVNWYKTNLTHEENIYEFSLMQIKNYIAKAQKMNMIWTR